MVISVVAEFHWPPKVFGGLFFDSLDHEGLEFWYDVVRDINDKVKAASPNARS